MEQTNWFTDARFGLFIHYGLYSLLERGEWVMNRERIPRAEYAVLADSFTAENFDADAICELALQSGMRYITFTTMHHDGFRLYDTKLSDFNSVKACGRDLTGEIVDATRRHGLRIALYHSLNNWMDIPDAVDALENKADYSTFIESTFERILELVRTYTPIDILWYDGSWPFNAKGWQAQRMNELVREIQPHILFNGRNGLPGDFATPEQHLAAPEPWCPWEACMTHNESWGFHRGDHQWKTAAQVIDLLIQCAQGDGNLLLNTGPRGDGSIPEEAAKILREVGAWLQQNGEAIYGTEPFTFDFFERNGHRGDWNNNGRFTCKDNSLHMILRRWPGQELVLAGLECEVQNVSNLATGEKYFFTQNEDRIVVSGLPQEAPSLYPVLRFDCDRPPSIYLCGGMRIPKVAHPPYNPHSESDLVPGGAPG